MCRIISVWIARCLRQNEDERLFANKSRMNAEVGEHSKTHEGIEILLKKERKTDITLRFVRCEELF